MVPHHLDHSHSLLEGDHDNHSKHPVWVGVVTFGAILMFFIVERSLKISSDSKVCRNSKKVASISTSCCVLFYIYECLKHHKC